MPMIERSVGIGHRPRQFAKNPWDHRQVLGSLSGLPASGRIGGPDVSKTDPAGKGKLVKRDTRTVGGLNPQSHQGPH